MFDEGFGDAPSDVDFTFDLEVFEGLLPEALQAEGAGAAGYGTRGGALGEDAVDARFAHFVVAFWVDEEAHVGAKVAGGFADRADVWTCLAVVLCEDIENIWDVRTHRHPCQPVESQRHLAVFLLTSGGGGTGSNLREDPR